MYIHITQRLCIYKQDTHIHTIQTYNIQNTTYNTHMQVIYTENIHLDEHRTCTKYIPIPHIYNTHTEYTYTHYSHICTAHEHMCTHTHSHTLHIPLTPGLALFSLEWGYRVTRDNIALPASSSKPCLKSTVYNLDEYCLLVKSTEYNP